MSVSVSIAIRSAVSICSIKLASCAESVITFRVNAIRSAIIQRWFWSHSDYQSTFPSLREAEALPSFCAASARVPIHRDDTTAPRAGSLRAEKFLWLGQRLRLYATGHDSSPARLHVVVSARKPRDTVEQKHNILPHFHEAFGALHHHLCYLHVSLHAFVKIGMVDLAVDFPLQVRHFFRPLVHQKQDKNNVRMIYPNCFGDFL